MASGKWSLLSTILPDIMDHAGFVTRTILIVISVTVIAAIGYVPRKSREEPAQTNTKITAVYEKAFDEPVINIIFDTTSVGIQDAKRMGWKETIFSLEEKTSGKAEVLYPKVVITSKSEDITYPISDQPEGEMRAKEIRFYDKDGRIVKTVSARYRLLRSENGKYLIAADLFGDGYDKEGNYINYPGGGVIYNWDGNEIGTIPVGQISQVSNDGCVLDCWGLVVYDSLGRKTGSLKPVIGEEPPDPIGISNRMSRDGEYIITTIPVSKMRTFYALWNRIGEILWIKEFPFRVWGTMPLSHKIVDGEGIIGQVDSESGKYLMMFGWDGSMKWQIHLVGFWGNPWSKLAGDKVFLCSSGGYLYCAEHKRGMLLWQHQETWSLAPRNQGIRLSKRPLYEGMTTFSEGEFVAVRTRGTEGTVSTVIYFDGETGRVLGSIDYQHKISLFSSSDFSFTAEGNKVVGHMLVRE
jgi:hypothetical protein